MRPWIFLFVLVISACSGAAAPTATSVPLPPETSSQITAPQSGMIIYEETLQLRGTFEEDAAAMGLRLQVQTALNDELLDTKLQPENGAWSYELAHNYEGDPVEVTILLLPGDESTPGEYDIVSVVLSPPEYRPEGDYAEIYHPAAGERVGGDVLVVEGVASGLRELKLVLKDADSVVSEQVISFEDGDNLNEHPWLVELPTAGTTGRASLHLYDEDDRELHRIDILVDEVAG